MKKPNVVLIVSDQHQSNVTGCYGNDIVKTPNIDNLAKDGVLFQNAYCSSPLCAPSRASILTGQNPCVHGALYHKRDANPKVRTGVYGIGDNVPTLGRVFRDAGYRTASIGKLHVHGETNRRFPFDEVDLGLPDNDLGFDVRLNRFYTYQYQEYVESVGEERKNLYIDNIEGGDSYNFSSRALEMEEKYNQDSLCVESSLKFIEESADKPFLLLAGLEKPHIPWTIQEEWLKMYNPNDMPLAKTLREQEQTGEKDFLMEWQRKSVVGRSDREIQNAVAAYYANVTNADHNVGLIIDKLKECGVFDNTIIAYTTDHGELLFEHSAVQKHCHYESSVRVPLIISYPKNLPKGMVCNHPTTLIDLLPTLSNLTGIKGVSADLLDGESLVDICTGKRKENKNREIYSEFHHHMGFHSRMLIKGDFKYIYTCDNSGERQEQLYNLKSDPLEVVNLANSCEYSDTKSHMRKKVLSNWPPKQGD